MNDKILAKESEKTYAEYFINWANDTYNPDYYAVPNEQEDSEIDVFAISKSGRSPTLNLQIVTSRGKTLEMVSKNKRRFKQGEKFMGSNVEWFEWIARAIEQKEEKYPVNLKGNLILLPESCTEYTYSV